MVINDGDGVDLTHSITSGLALQQPIYNPDICPPPLASEVSGASLGSTVSIAVLQPPASGSSEATSWVLVLVLDPKASRSGDIASVNEV